MRCTSKFNNFRNSVLSVAAACLFSQTSMGQVASSPSYIPRELQARNPDVEAGLSAARSSADSGKYEEAFAKDQQALIIAKMAGFSGDVALAEASVASSGFVLGKLQDGWNWDRDALQKAIDSSNLVLQADILTSLSASYQSEGRSEAALALLTQALGRADASKNLWIKSRVLGELGRMQLLQGNSEVAKNSIDEALKIDSLNNYKFLPLHQVYKAYFLLSDSKTVEDGIHELEMASDAAISEKNYLALVLAESGLGITYVHTGKTQEGIEILHGMSMGETKIGQKLQAMPVEFHAVLQLPFIHILLLEDLGNAEEALKRTSDAIDAWSQLYSFSNKIGLNQASAEAAQHLASLYAAQGNNENAAMYFRDSANQWQSSGNDLMLLQTLAGEAASFIKAGQSAKALSAEDDLAQVAIRLNNSRAEFLAYLAMAEIRQPAGQLEQARIALEKAQSLIKPGPSDSALGDEAVVELYLRLSDIYEKDGDQVKQLAEIEKALAVRIAGKDQKQINELVAVLRQKFDNIHVEDLISKLYASGKIFDALRYSQLVWFFQGVPSGTIPLGKAPLYWQLVTNGPFQLATEQNGDQELEQDLDILGPVLGFEKWPVIQALSQHYVFNGIDSEQFRLGKDYARQAIALIDQTKSLISPQGLRLHSLCTLAVAYARTNEMDLASDTIHQCMDLENKSNDLQEKTFANVANVYLHMLENNLAEAQESLTFIKKNVGANPLLDEELAIALGKGGHTQDAMGEFSIALRAFQAQNDTTSKARCFTEMATALDGADSNESKKQQLDYLTQAAHIYHAAHDLQSEAATNLAMGQYFAKLGKSGNAKRFFRQALDLSSNAGNKSLRAWIELFFGNFYFAAKQYDKASELHHDAVADFSAAKDQFNEASAMVAVGLDLEAMRQLDDALATYTEAQSLADKSQEAFTGQFVQSHIGTVYERIGFLDERQGQFERADKAFHKAEQVSKAANDSRGVGAADLALSEVDAVEGDWQDALEEATAAQEEFATIDDRDDESDADAELAYVYSDRTSTMKDFGMARKYFKDAQKLNYERLRELDEIEIDIQTKKYSDAVQMAKDGIAACHAGGDSDCTANALISLAEAERLSGDFKTSSETLKEAKPLVAKSRDFYLEGRYLYGEANQERAAGHFIAAVAFYERVIGLIEQAKGNIDPQYQLSMSDTYDFVYDELIDSLHSLYEQEPDKEKLKTAMQALNYAETNKARQFDKSWGQTFVTALSQKLPLDVIQKENSLAAKRSQLDTQLGSIISGVSGSTGTKAGIQDRLAKAQSELQDFVQLLRSKYPAYAAVMYPQSPRLDQIPLHPEETLVEFKMTDEATFVWMIDNEQGKGNDLLSFYKVPETKEWFYSQISKLRNAFNGGQPAGYDPQVSEQLFEALFPGKYAGEILEARRLILIPDDILFLLPFEMLSPDASQDKYVLIGTRTEYFPSAESFRMARLVNRSSNWTEGFLGVGDPITSRNDPRYGLVTALSLGQSTSPEQAPTASTLDLTTQVAKLQSRGFEFDRLPGTAKEIEGISELFSERHELTDVLLGMNATRNDVLNLDLSKFRYIHFATHGILPVDAGVREPSLVLSYDGTSADQMLLPISTILGLKVDADNVVLSACNTGSGKVSRAEGVMSLGRAFLSAGASSVTVSLWEVSDASTALLMKEYYRNLLLGKPKDEALADARTWLFVNGYKEPYNWAPFVLIGE